jgi:glutathione peroxidase
VAGFRPLRFLQVDVNGKDAHPLFRYLKTATPDSFGYDIQWNFTKFLLVNGVPKRRYPHNSNPYVIEPDIMAALETLSTQEL